MAPKPKKLRGAEFSSLRSHPSTLTRACNDRIGALIGHDYLFLPKGDTDVEKVAAREYGRLVDAKLRNNFRVLYLGADGGIYQYLPTGSEKLGMTIHEAMGLKVDAP